MKKSIVSSINIISAIILLTHFSNSWSKDIENREFDAKKIDTVQIDAPKGEIKVFGSSSDSKITVEIEKSEFDKKCKITYAEEGSKLKIDISSENVLFDKANCVAKITVKTKANVELKVSTSISSTNIDGVSGNIDFKSATGSLYASKLEANLNATTATGDITLKYHKCPKRADIDLLTASSDAEVTMPADCKIKVSYKSAAGELFNELGDSNDYKVLIKSKSASGNLKIKKLSKK